ncbi:MAG: hypothetical protein CMN75_09970 [Spirochaeta sp.]|nr:hypothetical protein [Spirochaeta sp.]
MSVNVVGVEAVGGEPSSLKTLFVSPKRLGLTGFLTLLLGVFFSSGAWATPVSYSVTSGSVVTSVSVGGVIIGSNTSSLTNGSFTIDASSQSLDDFSITLEPDQILNLSSAYGGYDTVTIETATLSSEPGFFSTLIGSTAGSYTVLASPLGVNGSWGGSSSTGALPPVSNQPIAYSVPSLTAVIGSAPTIFINAVTLNSLDGAFVGESEDLVVIASVNISSAVVVPESSTALLLGIGLAGFSWIRSSRH